MTEAEPFTPPTIESQYRYVHSSNIPPGRLAEMQEQITTSGVYIGEITKFSAFYALEGAVEVIETSPGGMVKIMPDVVSLPDDHPVRLLVRQDEQARQRGPSSLIGRLLGQTASFMPPQPLPDRHKIRLANRDADREVAELETTHQDLADFLQSFTAVADARHLGYGRGADYQLVSYCGSDMRYCTFIEPFGENGTTYALLRIDRIADRRPQVADEGYTIVNMDTGDSLNFYHSDVMRIRNGEYASVDARGRECFIRPRAIAEVAGFVDAHGAEDPIVILKKQKGQRTAIFETDEQIKRFERLVSLDSGAFEDARIVYAPATVEELMTFVTRLGSDALAHCIDAITVPEGAVSLVEDTEVHKFLVGSLLATAGKFDAATERAIYAAVSSIRIDADDGWTRHSRIEQMIRAAVKINEDGTCTKKPALDLLERLTCDRYDFLEAVYKASGGLYLESSSMKPGQIRPTRSTKETLKEQNARLYAEIFKDALMETVEIARGPLHIPSDIDPLDQIVMLLKAHGYTQKGMRLIEKKTVRHCRPDISIPEWAEICMIVDRCRDNPISDEDRAVIAVYGLRPELIAERWQNAPGAYTEHIAEELVWQL